MDAVARGGLRGMRGLLLVLEGLGTWRALAFVQ